MLVSLDSSMPDSNSVCGGEGTDKSTTASGRHKLRDRWHRAGGAGPELYDEVRWDNMLVSLDSSIPDSNSICSRKAQRLHSRTHVKSCAGLGLCMCRGREAHAAAGHIQCRCVTNNPLPPHLHKQALLAQHSHGCAVALHIAVSWDPTKASSIASNGCAQPQHAPSQHNHPLTSTNRRCWHSTAMATQMQA
jgi:hypothetical protein